MRGNIRVFTAICLYPEPSGYWKGYRLGRWIEGQRACYNNVPSAKGKLSQFQIALLEQIGKEERAA